jgi:ATP-dependent exoDNAse (exonuclease V) alpha subunit
MECTSVHDVPIEMLPSNDRDAGGLRSTLLLSVGSPVMLIRNIYAQHGLVNGVLGVVESFQCSHDGVV